MTDLKDIKTLVEDQGVAWEEFKTANDARLEAIESKGYAPEDLVEKVDTINADLTKIGNDLEEVVKKANRYPAADGDKGLSDEQLEHKEALGKFLRTGHAADLAELERKALTSTADPDGGFLVTDEMDATIDRVAETVSGVRQIARQVTIGNALYSKLVKTRGLSGGWLEENGTSAEDASGTNMQFSRVEIKPEKEYAEPWISNEMLEDASYNLEADVLLEAGITFNALEGAAFVTGNGVGRPRGFATYTKIANASYTWGSVGYIPSSKDGAFASVAPADDLISLQHGLKSVYRPNARWVMADATLATVRQFKDSSGAYYMWQPDTTAGFGGRLLGSPVVVDDNVAVVASDSYSVAYGDFAQAYTIVDRRGTAVIRDNVTKKGVTKFHLSRRVCGGITNFEAIKLMKFATS